MNPFIITVKTDLNGSLQLTDNPSGFMMTEDNLANRIVVELYRGQTKVDPDPSYTIHTLIKRDGDVDPIDLLLGDFQDGNIVVDLPESVYSVEGSLSIHIRLERDQQKIVVATIDTNIRKTSTNQKIDYKNGVLTVRESETPVEICDILPTQIQIQLTSEIEEEITVINQNGNESFEIPFTYVENKITIDIPNEIYTEIKPFSFVTKTDSKVISVINGYVDYINAQ